MSSTLLYDAYGDLVHSTGSGAQPPFGFGAQWGYYTDAESGLQLLTHRYFDAGTGRFINRVPIGQQERTNVYAYGANEPTTSADPFGLNPKNVQTLPIGPNGVVYRPTKRGRPPLDADGNRVELHHVGQENDGEAAEML